MHSTSVRCETGCHCAAGCSASGDAPFGAESQTAFTQQDAQTRVPAPHTLRHSRRLAPGAAALTCMHLPSHILSVPQVVWLRLVHPGVLHHEHLRPGHRAQLLDGVSQPGDRAAGDLPPAHRTQVRQVRRWPPLVLLRVVQPPVSPTLGGSLPNL